MEDIIFKSAAVNRGAHSWSNLQIVRNSSNQSIQNAPRWLADARAHLEKCLAQKDLTPIRATRSDCHVFILTVEGSQLFLELVRNLQVISVLAGSMGMRSSVVVTMWSRTNQIEFIAVHEEGFYVKFHERTRWLSLQVVFVECCLDFGLSSTKARLVDMSFVEEDPSSIIRPWTLSQLNIWPNVVIGGCGIQACFGPQGALFKYSLRQCNPWYDARWVHCNS